MAVEHSRGLRLVSRGALPLVLGSKKPELRAAVYARKSTDDNDRNSENKSVTRQVDHAKAYATDKAWTVDKEHIYIDDGVSGAEFRNRPALLRMLNALKQFDVIVMSELSRIGRDQIETAQCLANIQGAGVAVEFYLTNERLKFDTAVDRFITNAVSFAAELEREKASQRSRDALERKAKLGFNSGGIAYGYDNVIVSLPNGAGEQVKSHTDYRINAKQAEALLGIFKMYAAGFGHTAIAKTMNGDKRYTKESRKFFSGEVPATPRKGTGSWAPSSIREMLYNSRYTGRVPFGEFKKVYRGGTKKRLRVGDPTFADRPDLRIIPKDLWESVQSRLAAVRQTYVRENGGTLWGRPETGRESKYLLSGLARCGSCGASLIATKVALGTSGTRRLVPHYMCSYNSNRGNSICDNNTRKRQDELDSKVLAAIERSILTPQAVAYVVDRAIQMVKTRRKSEPDVTAKTEAKIKRLSRERDNLVSVCAGGRAPASVLTEIHRRERDIASLESELAQCPHRLEFDPKELGTLKDGLRARIGKFHDLMHAEVPLARQALRKLLEGAIKCTPVMRGGRKDYAIEGSTKLGALLTPASVTMASRRGFEPRLPP